MRPCSSYPSSRRPHSAAELVMFEQKSCVRCQRFDRDIAPAYEQDRRRKARAAAPPRNHAADPGPSCVHPPRGFTPVFVLIDDGKEFGRIRSYPGDTSSSGMLANLIERLARREAAPRNAQFRRAARRHLRRITPVAGACRAVPSLRMISGRFLGNADASAFLTRASVALDVLLASRCPPRPLKKAAAPKPDATPAGQKWVTTWAASVQGPYPIGNPSAQPDQNFAFPSPAAGARDQTFRLIVRPRSGRRPACASPTRSAPSRSRSTAFMSACSCERDARRRHQQAGELRRQAGVTIAPGEFVWSDAVTLPFVTTRRRLQGRKLAVSFHVAGESGPMTGTPRRCRPRT